MVWKLDRLARSLKDLVEIVQDLNEREVGFKPLTESIDTTSSGGRLRGTRQWPREKREEFANDLRYLWPVESSLFELEQRRKRPE